MMEEISLFYVELMNDRAKKEYVVYEIDDEENEKPVFIEINHEIKDEDIEIIGNSKVECCEIIEDIETIEDNIYDGIRYLFDESIKDNGLYYYEIEKLRLVIKEKIECNIYERKENGLEDEEIINLMSIQKTTEYVTTKSIDDSVEIIINQAIEDLIIENIIYDSVVKSTEIIINQAIEDLIIENVIDDSVDKSTEIIINQAIEDLIIENVIDDSVDKSTEIIINQAIEDLIIENVIDDSVDKSTEIIINQATEDSINKCCNKKNHEDINMSELESIKGSLYFSEKQLR